MSTVVERSVTTMPIVPSSQQVFTSLCFPQKTSKALCAEFSCPYLKTGCGSQPVQRLLSRNQSNFTHEKSQVMKRSWGDKFWMWGRQFPAKNLSRFPTFLTIKYVLSLSNLMKADADKVCWIWCESEQGLRTVNTLSGALANSRDEYLGEHLKHMSRPRTAKMSSPSSQVTAELWAPLVVVTDTVNVKSIQIGHTPLKLVTLLLSGDICVALKPVT